MLRKGIIGDFTTGTLFWIIFLILAIGATYLLVRNLIG